MPIRRQTYQTLQQDGAYQEGVVLVAELQSCAKQKDLHGTSIIHDDILKRGLLQKNIYVGSSLLRAYTKCGAFAKAREVFGELQVRDKVSWTVLITGYAQHGHAEEALNCYECMWREGFLPDGMTFASTLKACATIRAVDKGKEIHEVIVKAGMLEKDIFLGTVLVDMYNKCGFLQKAQEVFNKLSVRNVITWNVLITGYTQCGHFEEALNCYDQMQAEGLSPDVVTFLSILKACASVGAVDKGKEIHAMIVGDGLLTSNIMVATSLVDMYSRCNAPENAQELLEKLPIHNAAPWNALLAGLAHHGHAEQALQCFVQMQREGIFASEITFICLLRACSCIGAIEKGEELHSMILREGFIEKNILIGTALLDMYVKCGALNKAQEVFEELPFRDVVPWTVLMTGYSQLGNDGIVFDLYNKMLETYIAPNVVTFTVLLNASSHSGDVERGHAYFESMRIDYGISPVFEHYSCMVDLYSRAGHFGRVLELIKMMPSYDYLPLWHTLLGACVKWGNVRLGRFAFNHVIQLDAKGNVAYVLMSNIHVTAAMHEDAKAIEVMRVKNDAWEKPESCKWTDSDAKLHALFGWG